MEAWVVDSTIDAVEDYLQAYFKFNYESHIEKKETFKENWLKMLPIWVEAIEKRITANGGKFVAGDKITIADFAIASIAFNLLRNEANPHIAISLPLIKDHEVLRNYSHRLKEALSEHLTKRPQPRPF